MNSEISLTQKAPIKAWKSQTSLKAKLNESSKSLDIHRIAQRLRGQKGVYTQPREIDYYSVNSSNQVVQDESALKYYYPAELDADLGEGYPDRFVAKDTSKPGYLDKLLKSLCKRFSPSESGHMILPAQICTCMTLYLFNSS